MLDWWEKNFATCELSDRPLILASRSHPRLQLQVQSGFWLVLPEKSDAGFPVVNRAYGCSTHQIEAFRCSAVVRQHLCLHPRTPVRSSQKEL
ncbi:hypothetical protein [Nostoc sp. 'Peltigera membranacea cyanobiont' 210A]|uniref:hypothetical protein n=1 Tax=Nostoc sp. 'Peltigera membranacea cyanobiont' 210A TaxID=2014529 RepID=UPI00117D2B8F|nr:hypothetical protein [Nostoc sp. 'Peltigera membranacea cyanobiont' 210A]